METSVLLGRLAALGAAGLIAASAAADPFKQAADNALAAYRAGEDLAPLAAGKYSWDTADDLCGRGEFDAALAFATAARRPDTVALPAYVTTVRERPVDPAERQAFAGAKAAYARRDLRATWEAVKGVKVERATVPGIRLLRSQGYCLRAAGRFDESAARYRRAAELAEEIGWLAIAGDSLHQLSVCHEARGDIRATVAVRERRLKIERTRGVALDLGKCLANLAIAENLAGDTKRSRRLGEEALALLEGSPAHLATAYTNLSAIYGRLAEHERARDAALRALEFFERARDARGIASSTANLGSALTGLGDYERAQACFEKALRLARQVQDFAGLVRTLISLSRLHEKLGDFERAEEYAMQTIAVAEKANLPAEAAMALGAVAAIDYRRGAYADALRRWEESSRRFEKLGSTVAMAESQAGIALIHMALGDYGQALPLIEAMLKAATDSGTTEAQLIALNNLSTIHIGLDDFDRALAVRQQALRLAEEARDKGAVTTSLIGLAALHRYRKEFAEAQTLLERGLALARELGLKHHEALFLGQLGAVRIDRGLLAEALPFVEQSLSLARDIGEVRQELLAAGWLTAIYIHQGRPDAARLLARQGVEKLPQLSQGLDEEQGAAVRDRTAGILEHGLLAAVADGHLDDTLFFIESARAASLLESLGNRDALMTAALPPELVKEERAARASLDGARARLVRAIAAKRRKDIREARGQIRAATTRFGAVMARIQREAKAAADLAYPVPASVADVRAMLGEGDALILYAFVKGNPHALVLTRQDQRVVRLPGADVGDLPTHAGAKWDPAPARATLIDPLGLETATRVIVAPHGPAVFVPFAALLPKSEVVYVPSASAYRILRSETAEGKRVLALGDPDYGGRKLARLPATGTEAKAVGDVVLLRAQASPAGLREALGGHGRWRAVHLACHGLVNTERPLLSSLALSGGDLSAFDILRLNIPTDLAVLSACETARGKAYRAEGVLGFTRAFMVAGASRVLVSLWKVDDEATRALMVKFYELWKTRPTATALRMAQEHVRSHDKWKHPYYWAAWQLWGRPD